MENEAKTVNVVKVYAKLGGTFKTPLWVVTM